MIGTLCAWIVALIFGAYAVPHLIVAWFYKTKNLKKAYNAEWALVTGASSGARARAASDLDGPPLLPPAARSVAACLPSDGAGARAPARPARRSHARPPTHPPTHPPQASASPSRASWRARA